MIEAEVHWCVHLYLYGESKNAKFGEGAWETMA